MNEALGALEQAGLLRVPNDEVHSSEALMACSNDYLGLAVSPVSRETLFSGSPGSGASRLIHGTRREHLELEARLAEWVGTPHALLFSSGYAANVGTLACLCDPGAVIFSDALNHASIIDGCRLSRARTEVIRHLDYDELEQRLASANAASARWVVVESYFSMDGDTPDLARIRAICNQHDAFLMVDEAHALGVFGPRGAGMCAQQRVVPDVLMGTLGKALGVTGAFVAGSDSLRTWLWNRARSFVFSTAPSPVLCSLVLEHLRRVQRADGERERLLARSNQLRLHLAKRGVSVLARSHGPIVPIIVGDPETTVVAAAELKARNIVVQAIRPPTVAAGTSRLRVTLNAGMTEDQVVELGDAIAEVLG